MHCIRKVIEQVLLIDLKVANSSLNLIASLQGSKTLLLTLISNVDQLSSEILNLFLVSIHLVVIHFLRLFISLFHKFLCLSARLHVQHIHLLPLLITSKYIFQEDSLPLIVNILLSLFPGHVIPQPRVFKVFILLSKPLPLVIEILLLSLIGCLCSIMSFNGFL